LRTSSSKYVNLQNAASFDFLTRDGRVSYVRVREKNRICLEMSEYLNDSLGISVFPFDQ